MKESPAKLLEQITFFVDRSSGKSIISEGLKNLGLNVEKHDDHFEQITLDVEWIEVCGRKNWIVISSDKAIKKNELEKIALLNAGVAAFFFTSAQLTSSEQIEIITKALKRIADLVINNRRPFIARLEKNGDVTVWINHKGEDLIAQKIERQKLKKLNPAN